MIPKYYLVKINTPVKRSSASLFRRSNAIPFILVSAYYYCEKPNEAVAIKNKFDVSRLPHHLQAEFDEEENKKLMKHVLRNQSPVIVSPNWLFEVAWKCSRCLYKWTARPAERLATNPTQYYGCPHCREQGLNTSHPILRNPEIKFQDSSALLHLAYPHLFKEWNGIPEIQSQKPSASITFLNVLTHSPVKAKWRCRRCARVWLQSVRDRVIVLEQKQRAFPDEKVCTLCPECEMQDENHSSVKSRSKKMFLSDHSILLSEAQLREHQDPRTIPLTSATEISWQCPYCQWKYIAALKNRFLYQVRCPRCTGAERDHSNMLQLQRPDVLSDLSGNTPSSCFTRATQDVKPLSLSCKKCHTSYTINTKARCLVPPKGTSCPKCLYHQTL